jgi:hypothetical protein
MKIILDGLKVPLRARRAGKRAGRGKNNEGTQSDGWKAHYFPKGKSGNPGGKPKVPYVKFADRLADELTKPAPNAMKKLLGMHPNRQVTQYDCLVAAMVQAAAAGDWQASLGIRDVIEGRLPQTNYNLSVQMKAFMEDKQFQEFLQEQHGAYLQQIGDFSNAARSTSQDLFQLPPGEGTAGARED